LKRTLVLLLICAAAFGAINLASGHGLKEKRKGLKTLYRLDVVPIPAPLLRIAAGEFKGMAANYILLQAGAFLGSNQKLSERDYKNLALIFEQSITLDPYFQQTYFYAQAYLPWEAKMPEKAISLLEISSRHRHWDWRPPYYIGFNQYFFLKDFEKASMSFMDAGRIEGAPVLLPLLGARFAAKSGRSETAIGLLDSMLQDPTMAEAERKEITQRIEALKGVIYLKNALAAYRDKEGEFPDSLEGLIEKRIIARMPSNPYSSEYFYNKETGEVSFDKLNQQ